MLFVLIRMASLFLAVLAVPLSLLLLVAGLSFESKIFGIAGLLIGMGPLLVCIGKERESKLTEVAGLSACLVWVILTVWLAVLAPDGKPGDSSRIQHRYVNEEAHFQPHALGNLLPELDQFLLGFKLVPLVDRLFTAEQASRLSQLTTDIYKELEADAGFHALGSVMPQTYDDLWFQRTNQGHYFLYVPEKLRRDVPAPALVFLHGSGGNFKAYTWLLSKVADDLGMVLICPSYGMGNWASKDSAKVVRAALFDAGKVVKLDSEQTHLMGLSNGGLGVSHAARDLGNSVRSLTFVSPVFDREAIISAKFKSRMKDKPVFIITGAKDDRVPLQSVTDAAEVMQGRDVRVVLKSVSDADHFMFFSHRNEVMAQIKQWLVLAMKPDPASDASAEPYPDGSGNSR